MRLGLVAIYPVVDSNYSLEPVQAVWLPGMDSNHELDKIFNVRNLLKSKIRRQRKKRQKAGSLYKTRTKIF
jgi:hypothetical protein